jgi:predicted Zn-dependent peptidase
MVRSRRAIPLFVAAAIAGASGAHAQPPAFDAIISLRAHRDSAVTTARLRSGIVLHHRRTTSPPGRVVVTVSLSGGERLETPATRGVSRLAAAVLDNPATAGETAEVLAARLARLDIQTGGTALPDALVLQVNAPADRITDALTLVGSLLARTRADRAVVDAYAGAAGLRRRSDPAFIAESLAAAFDDDRPADGPALPARLRSFTLDQVQGFLDAHTASSPIEIAVAGDAPLLPTLRAAETALADVAERGAPAARSLAARAADAHADVAAEPLAQAVAPGPHTRELTTTTPQGRTLVLVCFPGVPMQAADEHRTLRAVAELLRRRASDRLRQQGIAGWGKTLGSVIPSPTSPCTGLLFVAVAVEPDDAQRTLDTLIAATVDLPLAPPDEAELASARDELAQTADTAENDARYWSGLLAVSRLRGLSPDAVVGAAAFYSALRPDTLAAAAKTTLNPAARTSIIVRPDASQMPRAR